MAEHYNRNTTGVMKWCNRCGKNTMHKVSGKKIGLCENSHAKNTGVKIYEEPEKELF
jgi:hypothetical protein